MPKPAQTGGSDRFCRGTTISGSKTAYQYLVADGQIKETPVNYREFPRSIISIISASVTFKTPSTSKKITICPLSGNLSFVVILYIPDQIDHGPEIRGTTVKIPLLYMFRFIFIIPFDCHCRCQHKILHHPTIF